MIAAPRERPSLTFAAVHESASGPTQKSRRHVVEVRFLASSGLVLLGMSLSAFGILEKRALNADIVKAKPQRDRGDFQRLSCRLSAGSQC